MAKSFFSGQTLDDVMRAVLEEILTCGEQIQPTKGPAKELTGILVEITNPRARLSRTETRGKPFSCLGELCWYLAKSCDVEFISYYLPKYKKFAEEDIIFGGYGPRLFAYKGEENQVANVITLLRRKQQSRRAVIQLFDSGDIAEEHKDVPCTCTLQFMIRGKEKALHMIVHMRSSDIFWGFPHDVFCFTILQEIMARSLSVPLGTYKHVVGSSHLYDNHKHVAKRFIEEGWQSTDSPMPPMPDGDPWPAIESLLEAERTLRTGDDFDSSYLDRLDGYWADLIRLLQVFRFSKMKDADNIRVVRENMASSIYDPFIDKRISGCNLGAG